MNWFSLLILFGALQGIILSLVLYRFKRGNKKANLILSGFILIIVFTLLGRYFYTLKPISLFYIKVLFIGDLIIFLYGPMLFFYLKSLLSFDSHPKIKVWFHFIPLTLFVITVFPLMFATQNNINNMFNSYKYIFMVIEAVGILQNGFYVLINYTLLNTYLSKSVNELSHIPQIKFFKILLSIVISGVLFWLISFLARIIDPQGAGDYLGYQLVWFSLSCSIILLGYYTLSNPEVFWIPINSVKQESKISIIENIDELTAKLEAVMKESKPHLKPKLTLADLSEISGINVHLLSRIINEKYNRNFFEFINYFRVEEFKLLVKSNLHNNLTFLAIAYQVGFNSKTAFNTSFKKITNKTPREYFADTSYN